MQEEFYETYIYLRVTGEVLPSDIVDRLDCLETGTLSPSPNITLAGGVVGVSSGPRIKGTLSIEGVSRSLLLICDWSFVMSGVRKVGRHLRNLRGSLEEEVGVWRILALSGSIGIEGVSTPSVETISVWKQKYRRNETLITETGLGKMTNKILFITGMRPC